MPLQLVITELPLVERSPIRPVEGWTFERGTSLLNVQRYWTKVVMSTGEEKMEFPVELSVEEYLRAEEASEIRHEYVNRRAAILEKDKTLELPSLKFSLPLTKIYAGVELSH